MVRRPAGGRDQRGGRGDDGALRGRGVDLEIRRHADGRRPGPGGAPPEQVDLRARRARLRLPGGAPVLHARRVSVGHPQRQGGGQGQTAVRPARRAGALQHQLGAGGARLPDHGDDRGRAGRGRGRDRRRRDGRAGEPVRRARRGGALRGGVLGGGGRAARHGADGADHGRGRGHLPLVRELRDGVRRERGRAALGAGVVRRVRRLGGGGAHRPAGVGRLGRDLAQALPHARRRQHGLPGGDDRRQHQHDLQRHGAGQRAGRGRADFRHLPLALHLRGAAGPLRDRRRGDGGHGGHAADAALAGDDVLLHPDRRADVRAGVELHQCAGRRADRAHGGGLGQHHAHAPRPGALHAQRHGRHQQGAAGDPQEPDDGGGGHADLPGRGVRAARGGLGHAGRDAGRGRPARAHRHAGRTAQAAAFQRGQGHLRGPGAELAAERLPADAQRGLRVAGRRRGSVPRRRAALLHGLDSRAAHRQDPPRKEPPGHHGADAVQPARLPARDVGHGERGQLGLRVERQDLPRDGLAPGGGRHGRGPYAARGHGRELRLGPRRGHGGRPGAGYEPALRPVGGRAGHADGGGGAVRDHRQRGGEGACGGGLVGQHAPLRIALRGAIQGGRGPGNGLAGAGQQEPLAGAGGGSGAGVVRLPRARHQHARRALAVVGDHHRLPGRPDGAAGSGERAVGGGLRRPRAGIVDAYRRPRRAHRRQRGAAPLAAHKRRDLGKRCRSGRVPGRGGAGPGVAGDGHLHGQVPRLVAQL